MAERQDEQDDGEEGSPSSSSPPGRRRAMSAAAPPNDDKKHAVDESLLEPFAYISSIPGKDVRSALIDCFNSWLRVPEKGEGDHLDGLDVLSEIKCIVSSLHDASLLIDDVEDDSNLRRGAPVAHAIFGVPPTINAANYVYFLALERCLALGNEGAMRVFVSEMLNLHRGQGRDIRWRDAGWCPTEREYVDMVVDKTGGLFRLAVGLLQSFATTNADVDYVPLVNDLGLYFQVRDDLLNLADDEYMRGKSFCEDLTEGKFSLPIVHCIRGGGGGGRDEEGEVDAGGGGGGGGGRGGKRTAAAASTQLLSILKRRTEDVDVKRYARRLMIDAGSLRHAREECARLRTVIAARIERLGGNEPLSRVVDALHAQVEGIPDEYLRP